MRHRRVFLSLCLIGMACGADGVAQTLGRPASPAAQRHDMSYSSWADLPDAWGYFPPSGIMDRQRMLFWADRLRNEALALERRLAASMRAGQSADEIEAVRAVRIEAEFLRQDLLFGSHMGDFRLRLESLAAALDSVGLRESTKPSVRRWVESGDESLEKIAKNSGPWPREPLVSGRSGFAPGATQRGEKRGVAGEASARSSSRP